MGGSLGSGELQNIDSSVAALAAPGVTRLSGIRNFDSAYKLVLIEATIFSRLITLAIEWKGKVLENVFCVFSGLSDVPLRQFENCVCHRAGQVTHYVSLAGKMAGHAAQAQRFNAFDVGNDGRRILSGVAGESLC